MCIRDSGHTEGADSAEKGEEDRDLDQQRQTTGCWRSTMLFVESHDLFLLLSRVISILLTDLFHLRRQHLHLSAGTHLLILQGLSEQLDDQGERCV